MTITPYASCGGLHKAGVGIKCSYGARELLVLPVFSLGFYSLMLLCKMSFINKSFPKNGC